MNKLYPSIFASLILVAAPVFAGDVKTASINSQNEKLDKATILKNAEKFLSQNLRKLVLNDNLNATFAENGNLVLFRKGPEGGGSIYIYDPAINSNPVELVTEQEIANKIEEKIGIKSIELRLVPIDYFADEKLLQVSAHGRKWKYNLTNKSIEQLPIETNSGISPDGKFKVFARNYNLWLVDLRTDKEIPITNNGNFDNRYGQNYPLLGDIVAKNTDEPTEPANISWSEDSKSFITYRLERNDSNIWEAVQQNPIGSQFPRSFKFVYPTAGAKKVPLVKPLLVEIVNGKPVINELAVPSTELLWPGDPPLYWSKSGKIFYEWSKRGYSELALYEIDKTTKNIALLAKETAYPIITVTSSSIRGSDELGGALIISEKTDWAQLYLTKFGENPDSRKALTNGQWEVAEIQQIDQNKNIFISGIGREKGVNPYYRALYKVNLNGKMDILTPEPLDHETIISSNGKYIIDKMSAANVPTKTLVRNGQNGSIIFELGEADASQLYKEGFTAPEIFETLADDGKTKLYATIFRPANFNPNFKYPIIENVYTGPTTHIFGETFSDNIFTSTNYIAQLGAIVVTIDGRGTSQRGKEFRSSAYQNLGEVGVDDHIHVIKEIAKKYKYIDLNRVGVYGGSAGGYDTARFLLRRPDFYKVGVASSGNHDLRLDKAWWPEVSMGIAEDAVWEKNSNISVAKNLKGKLMLVHGDIDDNVPVTATLRLSKALIDAGKPHEVVILPNTNHAVYQPYFWQKLSGFFLDNLINENK